MPKERQTLVVACEAGAGNVLCSWLKEQSDPGRFVLCLIEPAAKIFAAAHPSLERISWESFAANPHRFERVILGSSWMPDLERRALEIARKNRIPSIGVIDHWVNYRERFLPVELRANLPENWASYLPDQVWVCDPHAYRIAIEAGYPPDRLTQVENHYMAEMRRKIEALQLGEKRSGEEIRLLYICEPIAEDLEATYGDARYWGFTEYDLADKLLQDSEASPHQVKVRMRPHPNEAPEKYTPWVSRSGRMEISSGRDLAEDIAWADAIVGLESMAMVIALYSNKPVFSILPADSKKPFYLPFPEIRRSERPAAAIEHIAFAREKRENIDEPR